MTRESKQRALRIDLDHQHRPDTLVLWKWRLACAAAVLSTACIAWLCWPAAARETAFSPGDVTSVHAGLNGKCSACHEPFTPVKNDAWGAGDPHNRLLAEQKCEACHRMGAHQHSTRWSVENPTAHDAKLEATCSSCHREHSGFNASLLLIDDRHCTRCHANLPAPEEPKARHYETHISGFWQESMHPGFRSLSGSHSQLPVDAAQRKDADPGNIKFNHALHMTAGIPSLHPDGKKLTLGDVKRADARALRRWSLAEEADDTLVQLQCASCHQASTADGPAAIELAQASTPGDMLPVTFEQHCRACHALNVNEQPASAVPHGLQGAALQQAVVGLLTELPADSADDTRGRLTKLLGKTDPLAATESPSLSGDLLAARERLQTTVCQKCHFFEEIRGPLDWLPPVKPANIPERWLEHARFDHAPHRSQDCRLCHAAAYPTSGDPLRREPTDDAIVMIAGKESCITCHRPATSDTAFSGARHDCVECHGYHHPLKQSE